jgi:xanthine/uracil permease
MLRDVGAYTLARLLLAAALTALIYGVFRVAGVSDFPIYIGAAFAIVIALPLGMWIFSPLRRRATAGIAAFDERRRHDREQLQARLRGETPPE